MIKNPSLEKIKFSDIELSDPFFESLKEDYQGFDEWFQKKSDMNDELYVTKNNDTLTGILYLKIEDEEHLDITPTLPRNRRLKIGTLKIDSHGTNLGQYYINTILHKALYQKIEEVYVTIFPKHEGLIKLVERYGFTYHGTKDSPSGIENVYIKALSENYNNIFFDYPRFKTTNNIYLLSITPKYHTRLFGDSILKTENPEELLQDISHTNSIHKVYVCAMEGVTDLNQGDILVIYRTAEQGKGAFFNSVATSICVVGEYKNMYSYPNENDMVRDIERYSVFTADELREFYHSRRYPYIIKMLYNVPLKKRITMQKLIEDCGLSHSGYWGFRNLTEKQLDNILRLGEVDENFIIN